MENTKKQQNPNQSNQGQKSYQQPGQTDKRRDDATRQDNEGASKKDAGRFGNQE